AIAPVYAIGGPPARGWTGGTAVPAGAVPRAGPAGAELREPRSGSARRTRQARPHASSARINHHDKSGCHHLRPCRADHGNAWWLLCHPSPNAKTAVTTLFRLPSAVGYGRVPHRWFTEFTHRVAWSTRNCCRRPPHRNPTSASYAVPPTA